MNDDDDNDDPRGPPEYIFYIYINKDRKIYK